jgi:hypothetical protein
VTRAKHPGRRFDWAPGNIKVDANDVLMHARFDFLLEADALYPDLLIELSTLAPDDDASLDDWANRWGLTPDWCTAQARASLADHCAGEGFDMTRHGWGVACDELTPFGWTADPDRPRPTWTHKDREAFQRLAHFVCGGQSFTRIASEAGVSVQAVHESIRQLGALIGLPLRTVQAGRPRHSPIS